MRGYRIAVVVLVLIAGLQSALAADFQAGVDAFDRGDYAKARAEWQPLATDGNALAQYNLALMYTNGWGVPADALKAMHWFAAAAERGNAAAQYNLALMRQTGNGVPTDESQAVFWYQKAAAQGLANAQNNLALMYIEGAGVRRDPARAVHWLTQAAQHSDDARANRRDYLESLPRGHIEGRSVNVRAGGSGTAAVRTQAGPQRPVRVLSHARDWTQIWLTDTDTVGWVSNSLISTGRGTVSPAPSDVPVTIADSRNLEPAGGQAPQPSAPMPPPASVESSAQSVPSKPGPVRPQPARSRSSDQKTPRLVRHVGWLDRIETSEAHSHGRVRRVATDNLNVRARPTTGSKVITRLAHNTQVHVEAEHGSWRRIRLPGGDQGWVAAFLLKAPRRP